MTFTQVRDISNGDYCYPAYKWQDVMGVWHEKSIYECNQKELLRFSADIYNALVMSEVNNADIIAQRNRVENSLHEITEKNNVLNRRIIDYVSMLEHYNKKIINYQWITIFLIFVVAALLTFIILF